MASPTSACSSSPDGAASASERGVTRAAMEWAPAAGAHRWPSRHGPTTRPRSSSTAAPDSSRRGARSDTIGAETETSGTLSSWGAPALSGHVTSVLACSRVVEDSRYRRELSVGILRRVGRLTAGTTGAQESLAASRDLVLRSNLTPEVCSSHTRDPARRRSAMPEMCPRDLAYPQRDESVREAEGDNSASVGHSPATCHEGLASLRVVGKAAVPTIQYTPARRNAST